MRLTIIAVGKLKRGPYRDMVDDYVARIGRYLRCDEVEVRAARKLERKGAEVALRAEGEALLAAVPRGSLTVAMTEDGERMTSRELAAFVERAKNRSQDLAFLIGGALGFDDGVRTAADRALSLSPMTLPHELARVVLAEQLYRAMTISAREPYHKD